MVTVPRLRSTQGAGNILWNMGISRWLLIVIPLYAFLLLGSGLILGSKGPLYITFIVSVLIGINSAGLRYTRMRMPYISSRLATKLGGLAIYHSHHMMENYKGHEIYLKGKYFCSRCYGLVIGIILSLIIFMSYLIHPFNEIILIVPVIITALLIIPLFFWFRVQDKLETFTRFISGLFSPIIVWIVLIYIDYRYVSWILNSLTLAFVFILCTTICLHKLYDTFRVKRTSF